MTKTKTVFELWADLELTPRDASVLFIVARYQDEFRERGLNQHINDISSNALLVAQAILGEPNESTDITAVAKYYREWNEQCELYHKN